MGDPRKLTKRSKSRIPLMTADDRVEAARGFVIVSNGNPLPAWASSYKLMINEDAVITKYVERKSDGAGKGDLLVQRQMVGITFKTLLFLNPPRQQPIIELEVASGSIVAYLEDADL